MATTLKLKDRSVAFIGAVFSLGSLQVPEATKTFPLHMLFQLFFCEDFDKLFAARKCLLDLYLFVEDIVQMWSIPPMDPVVSRLNKVLTILVEERSLSRTLVKRSALYSILAVTTWLTGQNPLKRNTPHPHCKD